MGHTVEAKPPHPQHPPTIEWTHTTPSSIHRQCATPIIVLCGTRGWLSHWAYRLVKGHPSLLHLPEWMASPTLCAPGQLLHRTCTQPPPPPPPPSCGLICRRQKPERKPRAPGCPCHSRQQQCRLTPSRPEAACRLSVRQSWATVSFKHWHACSYFNQEFF